MDIQRRSIRECTRLPFSASKWARGTFVIPWLLVECCHVVVEHVFFVEYTLKFEARALLPVAIDFAVKRTRSGS